MEPKFKVGDLVQTIAGSAVHTSGIITAIAEPNESVNLLWGKLEQRYVVKDLKSGEHINVIERGIQKYEQTKGRRSTYRRGW